MLTDHAIAEMQKRGEAIAYSRTLMARGVSGPEQWEPLQEKYGYDYDTCHEVYEDMLDGVYWSIVEAKTNPYNFRAKRHHATRNNQKAPWSVRISAQVELDELYELVDVAKQPGGWENLKLLDAWCFYEEATNSETISAAQRHRVEKRMDLLMYGPKRERNRSEARDRTDRDMYTEREYRRTRRRRPGRSAPKPAVNASDTLPEVIPLGYDPAGPGVETSAACPAEETPACEPAGPRCAEDDAPREPDGVAGAHCVAEAPEDRPLKQHARTGASALRSAPATLPRCAEDDQSRCAEDDAPRCAEPDASRSAAVGHSPPAAPFGPVDFDIDDADESLPDSLAPAPPSRLVAGSDPAPRTGGARLVESQSDSADPPPPRAQPPP